MCAQLLTGGRVSGNGSGYDYPCESESSHQMEPTDRFCPIKFVPFRGVNCSDAAGHEIEYHLIQDTLDNNESLTGRMWDDSVSSPWYNYKAAGALVVLVSWRTS